MIHLQDAGDYVTCDFPNCKNHAVTEAVIYDDDGEDQGRELLCKDHAPAMAH
jgi:hypothetical protein